MYGTSEEQRIIDAEHLRLLRIGYFVSAGTTAVFALFGCLYLGVGVLLGAVGDNLPHRPGHAGAPPAFVGWLFGAVGGAIVALSTTVALLKLRVARCLRERKSHTFCCVIAVLSCLDIPYGTALGVSTFLVLTRPSVKELFGVGPSY